MDAGDRQASKKMGEGTGQRRASTISCGLHRLTEALGDRAHDRVDYAQPEDEPGLRVLVRDDGGSDLRGDDPTDAQKARQCRLMRASQTPSRAVVIMSGPAVSYSRDARSSREHRGCLPPRAPMPWPRTAASSVLAFAFLSSALGALEKASSMGFISGE